MGFSLVVFVPLGVVKKRAARRGYGLSFFGSPRVLGSAVLSKLFQKALKLLRDSHRDQADENDRIQGNTSIFSRSKPAVQGSTPSSSGQSNRQSATPPNGSSCSPTHQKSFSSFSPATFAIIGRQLPYECIGVSTACSSPQSIRIVALLARAHRVVSLELQASHQFEMSSKPS